MQYYEINEQTARRANDVNSMSDYRPGSATEEYRTAVDKAAALVQARKAKISPYYHDKLDALLDRYARRLADYYNAYYRNESACPPSSFAAAATSRCAKSKSRTPAANLFGRSTRRLTLSLTKSAAWAPAR